MVTCTKCDTEIIDEPFTVAKRKYYHAGCFIEQQEVKLEVSDPTQQQKIAELEKEIEELKQHLDVKQQIIDTLTKEQKTQLDEYAQLEEKHKQLFDKVKPFIDLITKQSDS